MLDMEMLMKFAPASVATAFASIVFPVPGGPKSNIPLQGYNKSNCNEVQTWCDRLNICSTNHLKYEVYKLIIISN
jgi:hypothetical protein